MVMVMKNIHMTLKIYYQNELLLYYQVVIMLLQSIHK